jgi:flagellar hook assembly protein FlgD
MLRYELRGGGHVSIRIHDTRGRTVRTLLDEVRMPGTYELLWDGLDASGKPVRSGIYLCQMKAGQMSTAVQMILIRR